MKAKKDDYSYPSEPGLYRATHRFHWRRDLVTLEMHTWDSGITELAVKFRDAYFHPTEYFNWERVSEPPQP